MSTKSIYKPEVNMSLRKHFFLPFRRCISIKMMISEGLSNPMLPSNGRISSKY